MRVVDMQRIRMPTRLGAVHVRPIRQERVPSPRLGAFVPGTGVQPPMFPFYPLGDLVLVIE